MTWQRQEKKTAKLWGGRRQPGSGNGWSRKGDVSTPWFLIENKFSGSKSLTLKSFDLEKICDEAVAEGRVPAFSIELNGRRYVLFAEDDVLEHFIDRMGTTGVAHLGEMPGDEADAVLPREG